MKLRNKKTGEIIDLSGFFILNQNVNYVIDWDIIDDHYAKNTPAEPLIKDKKIRKAVRAWAEAIDEKDNLVVSKNMEYHDCCIYCGDLGKQALIDFDVDLDIEENSYTIAELCGEED